MRFLIFCHSLRSDWNHGSAHFLRGIVAELMGQGHDVDVYEPEEGWSYASLVQEQGRAIPDRFEAAFPGLRCIPYRLDRIDLDRVLEGADVVLAHEWNDPKLIQGLGRVRARNPRMRLLLHDTHDRSVTRPDEIEALDLSGYDGVLAFGKVIRDAYLERGWARAAWTWHEAADTRVFYPRPGEPDEGDLVWIGDLGDEERASELEELLLGPVRDLGLKAVAYAERCPGNGQPAVSSSGIRYAGWMPNHELPRVFARHRTAVHVPSGAYTRALPGIPGMRVFEALACGIPLVCGPWDDAEGLLTAGRDYLVARDGAQMRRCLRLLLHEPDVARKIAANGLRTVLSRHRCSHRVQELFRVLAGLGAPVEGSRRGDPAPAAGTSQAEGAKSGVSSSSRMYEGISSLRP